MTLPQCVRYAHPVWDLSYDDVSIGGFTSRPRQAKALSESKSKLGHISLHLLLTMVMSTERYRSTPCAPKVFSYRGEGKKPLDLMLQHVSNALPCDLAMYEARRERVCKCA